MEYQKKHDRKYKETLYRGQKEKREQEKKHERSKREARKKANITKYQVQAMEILDDMGIEYIPEYPISIARTGFYLIDIYLPEYRICIEIDGSAHDLPDKKASDERRDEILSDMGYWIFRVKNYDVQKNFRGRVRKNISLSSHIYERYGKFPCIKTCKGEKKE